MGAAILADVCTEGLREGPRSIFYIVLAPSGWGLKRRSSKELCDPEILARMHKNNL